MRWIGAVVVIFCGGYFGFSMAASQKRDERTLCEIITAIEYMQCEIQYRLTPLPMLLEQASTQIAGTCSVVFAELATELENQISPEVSCCMEAILHKRTDIPKCSREVFLALGQRLGRYDLQGQLDELHCVDALCKRYLSQLENNRDIRLRSYQTLGICAGAAIAILLL